MFGRIPQWSCLVGPRLLFADSIIFITDSILLLVIVQIVCCLLDSAGYMFLEICLFLLGCPIYWHITVYSIFMIFCISVVSVIISPVSFLNLFIWVLFFLLGEPRYTFVNSLVAQRLKRLPPMRKTWVRSLGREDSPGEGNGNPLQYSCLENPMDGEAW